MLFAGRKHEMPPPLTFSEIWPSLYRVVNMGTSLFEPEQGDPGLCVNRMYENLYRPPTKIAIFGASRSPVTEASAQSSHYWNLIQVDAFWFSLLILNNQRIYSETHSGGMSIETAIVFSILSRI